jgi:hypothetical protein
LEIPNWSVKPTAATPITAALKMPNPMDSEKIEPLASIS